VAYADADTLRWLGWLAERMGAESVFYPDWMQPDWLPTRRQRWLATTGLGLAAVMVGLVAGLVGGPAFGLEGALRLGLGFGLFAGWASGLGMGLTRAGLRIEPIEPTRWSWSRARRRGGGAIAAMVSLTIFWLVDGLVERLVSGLVGQVIGGLLGGLLGGLAFVLASGFGARLNVRPTAPLEGIRATARVGRGSGLTAGLTAGLGFGLTAGPLDGLAAGLAYGLGGGLAVGLSQGGASYLRHRLLVALLQRQGLIPADLISFLDYADSRILLRRTGGGYLFIHRLLQDRFSNRARQTAPSLTIGNQKAARVQ
jgi:hypothetical protein